MQKGIEVLAPGIHESFSTRVRNQVTRSVTRTATLVRDYGVYVVTPLFMSALVATAAYNVLVVQTTVPEGGYRSSIAWAPKAPTAEPLKIPTPIPEAISAGDYIKLGYASLHKKDKDGVSTLDYLNNSGYGTISDKGYIPLAEAERVMVDKGQQLKVLHTPLPSSDPKFAESIAFESEKEQFTVYALFPIYDPKTNRLSLFGLTSYIGSPKTPGWVNLGYIDSISPVFHYNLRKEFVAGILQYFVPTQKSDIKASNT